MNGYLIGPYSCLFAANLNDADMSGVDVEDSDLSFANFSGAALTDADFDSAGLVGANLDGANLGGAELVNVSWSNTTCPDGTDSNDDEGPGVNNLG